VKPERVEKPMTAGKVEQVLKIEANSFDSPWPREAFQPDQSGAGWSRALVLEDLNRPEAGVQGFIIFWTVGEEMEIQNIAVDPGGRRRGGARALMEYAWKAARLSDCRVAFLEVRPSNKAGLGLYRKWGFQPAGLRKAYYHDGEDAIVMKAELGPE
jgi:ribosomal-protein-alanine N-acetyltransferase